MRRISRILCFLILPIVAMMCFTGCERDMTKDDIANKLSAIKETYKLDPAVGGVDNELFDADGLVKICYIGNEIEKIKAIDSVSFTDTNLQKRYKVMYEKQQKVLENALLYYIFMSDEFYSRLDLLSVSADELNEIYNGLEDLEDSFKEFKVAKDKFEQTVEVLTFEGVVRADLTAYSYSINVLIEDCIEFSNRFIDIVEKHLYSGEITESNEQLYAKHYLFEACHRLNEVAYYRYFKAYDNINECDLCNWKAEGGLYDRLFDETTGLVKKAKSIGENAINVDVEDILEFKEVRDSFVQKLGVYKIVYGSMDYYKYNAQLIGGKLALYKENVGSVEKANISLVEQFYETSLVSYYNDTFWGLIIIANQ